MAMYAGSYNAFFPIVRQGFAGVAVEGIAPGETAAAERPYLFGSSVARQMIIATRSDFHDSIRPGDDTNSGGTSKTVLEGQDPTGARARVLQKLNKAHEAAARALGDTAATAASTGRGAIVEDMPLLFRRSPAGGGLKVTYPDIEWAPLLG